jgi:hypothetical protein
VDLTIKAAAAGGSKAWGLIRQSADNKAVRTAVTKAGEKAATRAATNAADGATKRGSAYLAGRLDDRKHRLLAMDLARQIGGEVSLRTVIAGERYYVVWRGDEPVDSFPCCPRKQAPLLGDLSSVASSDVASPRRRTSDRSRPSSLRRQGVECSRCRFRLLAMASCAEFGVSQCASCTSAAGAGQP